MRETAVANRGHTRPHLPSPIVRAGEYPFDRDRTPPCSLTVTWARAPCNRARSVNTPAGSMDDAGDIAPLLVWRPSRSSCDCVPAAIETERPFHAKFLRSISSETCRASDIIRFAVANAVTVSSVVAISRRAVGTGLESGASVPTCGRPVVVLLTAPTESKPVGARRPRDSINRRTNERAAWVIRYAARPSLLKMGVMVERRRN